MKSRRPLVAFAALAASLATLLAPMTALAADSSDMFTRWLNQYGWRAALPAAFLGGVSTAATPCVYPMIGITVSVFGARNASRGTAAVLSTSFVHGIAVFFVPLGLLAGLTGSVAQAVAGHPAVLIGEALLMFAMALSMFGLFDVALPASLQTRLASIGGLGIKGAFLIGFALGPIAAPCATGPLTGILNYLFNTHDAALGAASLYAYSLGLGLPFWLVGTFAIALPKGGVWMNHVKNALGLVLLVMGLYYLRRLVPSLTTAPQRMPGMPWSGLVLVAAGIALGAIHLSLKEGGLVDRIRKVSGVVLVGLGAIWWITFVPPLARATANGQACTPIAWMRDPAAARALARREGRPLLMDFGGTWCGACEELAHVTFRAPEVACAAEQRRFVMVKIYDDEEPPPDLEQLERQFNIRSKPTVIVIDPGGREIARETRFVPASEMVSLMSRVDERRSER